MLQDDADYVFLISKVHGKYLASSLVVLLSVCLCMLIESEPLERVCSGKCLLWTANDGNGIFTLKINLTPRLNAVFPQEPATDHLIFFAIFIRLTRT